MARIGVQLKEKNKIFSSAAVCHRIGIRLSPKELERGIGPASREPKEEGKPCGSGLQPRAVQISRFAVDRVLILLSLTDVNAQR